MRNDTMIAAARVDDPARLSDTIAANLVVDPVPQTNLVIIRYRHTDPLLAQKVADTLADVFVRNNVERQEIGTSKATQDLAQEIAKYQEQIKKKQADIFNYAKAYELPLTDAPPVTCDNSECRRTVHNCSRPRMTSAACRQLTKRPRIHQIHLRTRKCRRTSASSTCARRSAT